LRAGEGGQRRSIRRHPHADAYRPARRTTDREHTSGKSGGGVAGVPRKLEPQMTFAIEAGLLDLHGPRRIGAGQGDAGGEARPQPVDGLHLQKGEVTRALSRLEAREMVDQVGELVLGEWRRVEREGVT